MIVYHYDPDTGVYGGVSSEADESPLEPGVFLIPANATEIEPPAVPAGQYAVFDDGAWTLTAKLPSPPKTTNENIVNAPVNLFGGPTTAQVFGAKP